ncbi:MAG TPA: DNA translocase FtsK, partial [Anaerolineales bacterium]|nr:DNA translocase FtsK [Anaerolineales bacterium]
MATKKSPSSIKENPDGVRAFEGVINQGIGLISRFQRFTWDFIGVFLLALSLLTFIALYLPSLSTGTLIIFWRTLIQHGFGFGAILVVIGCAAAGIMVLRMHASPRSRPGPIQPPVTRTMSWGRVIALELAGFSILALLSVLGGRLTSRAEAGLDGGFIGWGLAELLAMGLKLVGLDRNLWGGLLSGVIILLCLGYGLGLVPFLIHQLQKMAEMKPALPLTNEPAVSVAPTASQSAASLPGSDKKKRRPYVPAEFRKHLGGEDEPTRNQPPPPRDEHLPSLELLVKDQLDRPDERNINQTAGLIEKSLAEFGIPAKVVGYRVGPTVTQFALEPGFVEKGGSEEEQANRIKVRVAQIAGLRRDLALALSAERLRIEAPVPGRPFVGIEVPNTRTSMVRLRSILETEAFYKIGSPLAIALGRDVSGQPVVADLSTMPHLLIAGTTGSGKSVCIA